MIEDIFFKSTVTYSDLFKDLFNRDSIVLYKINSFIKLSAANILWIFILLQIKYSHMHFTCKLSFELLTWYYDQLKYTSEI